jgi:hypothetical protein
VHEGVDVIEVKVAMPLYLCPVRLGVRSIQGPYCSVLYRTTAHRADGGLFYHKLQYITVKTEMKLSAGGYHFWERCRYVLYPSPPPNHLPRKYLAAYEAPAAMLEQAQQHSLLRSLGQISLTPLTSGAPHPTAHRPRSTATHAPLSDSGRELYRDGWPE